MKQVIKRLNNVNIQVKNILSIYLLASLSEIEEGKQWYYNAHNLCRAMSDKYNLPLHTIVGILSALSPGTNWNQNIIDCNGLCSLLAAGKDIHKITCTTYNNNKLKAGYIYAHPELTDNEVYIVLLGFRKHVNKTASFYLNILHPEQDNNITIDRHSFRVNLGLSDTPDIALTEKRYRVMQLAYINASKNINVNAIQLQAITWLTFRRINNIIREKSFEIAPF
jgi:hypothetical protein